jgi:hypothetical protein
VPRYRHLALAALALAGLLSAQAADDKSPEIFNGKDLTGWKVYITDKDKGKTKPEEVWTVEEGVIKCKGRPAGYIITEKEYGDYVLELEWRWPAKKGNSGVLLHVSGKDKIWPKSFEAQLFAGSAGDIWLIDEYKLEVDKARQDPKVSRHYFRMNRDKPVEKEVGEWNKYKITCKGDTVKLEVGQRG